MKDRGEIYVLQDLANLAATLLNTGSSEAVNVASHPLAMIRTSFEAATAPADPASTQLEWDGKGLPPVGAACQCTFTGRPGDPAPLEKWMEGDDLLCVAHVEMGGKRAAIFWNMRLQNSCTLRDDCYKPFRPIPENNCNQFETDGPNPHYDPVAAATEHLRLARLARDEVVAQLNDHCMATEEIEHAASRARKAAEEAKSVLMKAIDAANHA